MVEGDPPAVGFSSGNGTVQMNGHGGEVTTGTLFLGWGGGLMWGPVPCFYLYILRKFKLPFLLSHLILFCLFVCLFFCKMC